MTALVRRRPGPGSSGGIHRLSSRALVLLILVALAASMLFPVYITLISSVKTLPEYQRSSLGWPSTWTFHNFVQAWGQGHMSRYALNSIVVVVMNLVLVLVTVTPAGFAFAKMRFRGQRFWLGALMALVIVSPGLQLVPIFKVANSFHLINSFIGLALIHTAFSLSFGVYMMSAYFTGVPSAVFEAAAIDGAGTFGTFVRIAIPIARPGILTLLTFTFLSCWNEYLYALIILLDPNKRTLPVGVAFLQNESYTSQPLLSAGLVITMLPCVLIFILLQRNLNEGLTLGMGK